MVYGQLFVGIMFFTPHKLRDGYTTRLPISFGEMSSLELTEIPQLLWAVLWISCLLMRGRCGGVGMGRR